MISYMQFWAELRVFNVKRIELIEALDEEKPLIDTSTNLLPGGN